MVPQRRGNVRTVEYALGEIREGAILAHRELRIKRVTFVPGRGVELHTSHPDGYAGPVIYPHPDEPVSVMHMPPLSDDDMDTLRISTSDYPWARVV